MRRRDFLKQTAVYAATLSASSLNAFGFGQTRGAASNKRAAADAVYREAWRLKHCRWAHRTDGQLKSGTGHDS